MKCTGVVLLNLGGPDSLSAVQPFLYNLFSDPAIIPLPSPLRQSLAFLLSWHRQKKSRQIFAELGGKSPLVTNTTKQAEALQEALGGDYRVVLGMRYWAPFIDDAAFTLKQIGCQRVILLPLYPQFSTTTTASSFRAWEKSFHKFGWDVETQTIGCYPTHPGWIKANQSLIAPYIAEASAHGPPRLLFSAHGLPQSIVDKGDPYAQQVEESVKAVMAAFPTLDYRLCYQSRVGPKKWLSPSLDVTLQEAARENVPVVVVPISFVSEHSETLVELDQEYKAKAAQWGISYYGRVPTVSCHPLFIQALRDMVLKADKSFYKAKIKGNTLSSCSSGMK